MSDTKAPFAPRATASPKKFRKYAPTQPSTEDRGYDRRPRSFPKHRDNPSIPVDTRVAPPLFVSLGVPSWLAARLAPMEISEPTEIQTAAIPVALTGVDVVGLAQTGTGKTLAFGLPMLARMAPKSRGLVLAPTRELAVQIEETLNKLGVRTALLIGGAPMNKQIQQLRSNPRVIVATPGRLADHMNQKTVSLRDIQIAVLDEADRMLDMGFIGPIRTILSQTPNDRQTLLFSATFPKEIEQLASEFMNNPERVEVARQGTAAELVTQELLVLARESKGEMLRQILYKEKGTVLVFSRTRHGASKLAKVIRNDGHSAAELHSDRTLSQRMSAMRGFKSGEYRILVATDIAARGIDVKGIALVVNFDIPENPEDYVHRIGRTGRAGASGHAITFATPDQHRDVRDIEKLMGCTLEISPDSTAQLPSWPSRSHNKAGGNSRPNNNQGRRPFRYRN